MNYFKYLSTIKYLNEDLIRPSHPDLPNSGTRREWMIKFLEELGHPEKAFPAIHIAGTSGKGTTAIKIASALKAAGYKVGLHTSPYLQVATERSWCDGRYASADEFTALVEWIRPICEKWKKPDAPLHGMASFGISLEYFRRKEVDVAVIETSVGGRDDLTNVLDTRVSVITPIGIDHVLTLGNTIEKIATHKAGIIKERTPVVAWHGEGSKIIKSETISKQSPLHWTYPDGDLVPGTSLYLVPNLHVDNLARLAVKIFDGGISNALIDTAMSGAVLPGRLELVQDSPRVILDGAHNEQKLEYLFKHVTGSPIVVLGMLACKDHSSTINMIRSRAKELILTVPKAYGKDGWNLDDISVNAIRINDCKEALDHALRLAGSSNTVLVTGSLFLVGEIRELYYPSEKIIEQRTSWPI